MRNRARAASSRVEPRALVLLVVVAACLWAFVGLADEVVEGETHGFDTRLLLALRNPADPADPLGPGWVEELGRDVTALGGFGILTDADARRSRASSGCRATAARCG